MLQNLTRWRRTTAGPGSGGSCSPVLSAAPVRWPACGRPAAEGTGVRMCTPRGVRPAPPGAGWLLPGLAGSAQLTRRTAAPACMARGISATWSTTSSRFRCRPRRRAIDRSIGNRTRGRSCSTSGARMDRHAATRRLRHLAEAAASRWPGRTRHARHTFVTTMLDAGVDLRDVQIAPAMPIRARLCV